MELLSGWSVVSDTWKLGAPGNDGESFGTYSGEHDSKVQVSGEFIDFFFNSPSNLVLDTSRVSLPYYESMTDWENKMLNNYWV